MSKKLYVGFSSLLLTASMYTVAFADGEWGENLKNWIVKQASALALAAVVIIIIPLIIRKAWMALIGTLAASAIALFFVNNPDKLQAIGATLYKIIFGG